MKKIAVIGISNLIISTGYGAQLKKLSADKTYIYIYGLGTNASLMALFELLRKEIIDNYDYVVLDYCISDTLYLYKSYVTKEIIVAWLVGIMNLFKDSRTIPIFLILPQLDYPLGESSSYLYRAIARIFNIPVIDIEYEYNHVNSTDIAPWNDINHFFPEFQEMLAQRILKEVNNIHPSSVYSASERINFSLLDVDYLKNFFPVVIKSTARVKDIFVKFKIGQKLNLPKNYYLCGIYYWCEKNHPYISFKNSALHLIKNLNLNYVGFFCRPICVSCSGGTRGGTLTLETSVENAIYERDNCGYIDQLCHSDCLYINSLLLCDSNPYNFGLDFIESHLRIFTEEKNRLAIMTIQRLSCADRWVKETAKKYVGKKILAYGAGAAFEAYAPFFSESTIMGIILDDKFLADTNKKYGNIPYIKFSEVQTMLQEADGCIIFCRPEYKFAMMQKIEELSEKSLGIDCCILYN